MWFARVLEAASIDSYLSEPWGVELIVIGLTACALAYLTFVLAVAMSKEIPTENKSKLYIVMIAPVCMPLYWYLYIFNRDPQTARLAEEQGIL